MRAMLSFTVAALLLSAPAIADIGDQTPGAVVKVTRETLPKPRATPSTSNGPRTIAKPASDGLHVPQGFAVNVFADRLSNARNLLVLPNGDVLLAETGVGRIRLLRDGDGDGKAELSEVFAEGFHTPHGMTLTDNNSVLLIGDLDGVWRIPYTAGDTKARAKQERITDQGALGTTSGHFTRNVLATPDGKKLYVAIGSAGNIGEEAAPRATIQLFDLNADATKATNRRTYASGTRNPVGIAFYPGTSDLYTTVNERDTEGDELVPDYLTKVADGGFYGWPYSYIGQNPQPGYGDKRPDLVAKAIVPDVLFRSHSAPLGFAFYTGNKFPADWRSGAYVALHGSWNSASPRGYIVAFVPFSGGKPAGDYKVFASGFWIGDQRPEVWGRPAGIAVAKDGSLLIADDTSNTVWRVSYTGK
jgi:glucose/arabinose dehydrogenase